MPAAIRSTKRFSAVRTEREEFAEEGYLIRRAFLGPAEVARLLLEIEQTKARCLKLGGLRPPPFQALFSPEALTHLRASCQGAEVFGPGKGNCDTLGHGLHRMPDTGFFELAHSAKLSETLREVYPELAQPKVVQTKVIFKPAKTGVRVPTHTDEQYIFTKPISGIALWIALDVADRHNGCVQVVPRSHRAGEYEPGQRFAVHGSTVRWEEQPSTGGRRPFPYAKHEVDQLEWTLAEMQPGDCLFMDVRLLHASSANTSKAQRRALTLHLVDAECEWDDKNWIHLL